MNLKIVIPRTDRTQSGFSMIEVSVAVAVMAIGIVAILGLFANSLGGSRDSAQDTIMALQAKTLLNTAENSSDFLVPVGEANLDLSQATDSIMALYDSSGNYVTNLSVTNTLVTNRAFIHSNRVSMYAVIRSYNLGGNSNGLYSFTNSVLTNQIPANEHTCLVTIQMVAPPGTAATGAITQNFQTLILRNTVNLLQ